MHDNTDWHKITEKIKDFGLELGFQQIGISDIHLATAGKRLNAWLQQKLHGSMEYMEKHGSKRFHPEKLVPKTIRIICARMNYLPPNANIARILENPLLGFISRYAVGRDYHKVMRKRLTLLAAYIKQQIPHTEYRVFSDSAPVMEKPLAEKAGLGWIGKNTNLIHSKSGSWFFLGTIYTNIPLILDQEAKNHCGSCKACIEICPTQAIIAPYQLDARKCISYLTIESRDAIPEELRSLMGNRIYGCDDCQLVCPWNKFAKITVEKDFYPRHQLDNSTLLELFNWSEKEFLEKTQGSAIRRIGYQCWLRNIAVALGNAPYSPLIIQVLTRKRDDCFPLVKEHVQWALAQQLKKTLDS